MASRSVSRDPWGRPLVEPGRLTRAERVVLLFDAAGVLAAGQALERYAAIYLGSALLEWLGKGGDLEKILGVRPERGSRLRAEKIVALRARDRLVVEFAARAGSDKAAVRIMQGNAPCPEDLAGSLAELREMGAPASESGIRKARRRLRGQG